MYILWLELELWEVLDSGWKTPLLRILGTIPGKKTLLFLRKKLISISNVLVKIERLRVESRARYFSRETDTTPTPRDIFPKLCQCGVKTFRQVITALPLNYSTDGITHTRLYQPSFPLQQRLAEFTKPNYIYKTIWVNQVKNGFRKFLRVYCYFFSHLRS